MLATLTHCERATLFSVNASKLRVDDDVEVGSRRDVSVGLFRVGAPTNDAAIVAKQGKGTVEETGLARGAVAFFAPRAAGAFVFVEEGTNGDQGFVLTNNGTITIGSTSLALKQPFPDGARPIKHEY